MWTIKETDTRKSHSNTNKIRKYEKNICKSLKKNKYQHDSITENKTYCIWIPKSCMLHYLFGIFLFFVFFFRVWVSLCIDWLMCLLNWNWNWNLLQYLPVFFPDFVFQIPFLAFTNIHTLVILFANFLQLAWKNTFWGFCRYIGSTFQRILNKFRFCFVCFLRTK